VHGAFWGNTWLITHINTLMAQRVIRCINPVSTGKGLKAGLSVRAMLTVRPQTALEVVQHRL
jgi:hypothetical protein